MSTFSLRRAHKKIEERKQQEPIEVVEEQVVEEIVEEVDVFVCPHCDKEYKTKRGLDKHIETKHDKDGE